MQFGQADHTNLIIGLWTFGIVGVCVSLAVLETVMQVPAIQ
ncbi:MAG: hypothetical protein P8O70_16830 [SAR324 cluster bacterium]|nr:hypothetical protein [SAR324 cluster bacterium]